MVQESKPTNIVLCHIIHADIHDNKEEKLNTTVVPQFMMLMMMMLMMLMLMLMPCNTTAEQWCPISEMRTVPITAGRCPSAQ